MYSKNIIRNYSVASFLFLSSSTLFSQKIDTLKTTDIEAVKIYKNYNYPNNEKLNTTSSHVLNHDAGRFLETIPEFSGVKKAANFATDPVLRGFKYEQLNIVIDGAANAINACPSRMDPAISQINMNMIERADIFKGPYNFRFGSTLGGSINFVTIPAQFQDNLKFKTRYSTSYESNGSIFRNELLSQLISKNINWDLFGSYQKGNRYKDGNRNEIPSAFLRYNIGTKGSIKWNENNKSILQITTNQGRNVEFAALKMNLIYDKTWMGQLKHILQINNSVLKYLDFNTYFSSVNHSMGTPDLSMISNVKSSTYGGRIESKWDWNQQNLFFGVDYKHEQARNISMKSTGMMMQNDGTAWQNSYINQLGWFNEYSYNFQNSKLIASFRLDFNHSDAKEPSKLFQNLYGNTKSNQTNISLSIGYKQNLNKQQTVSLWLGRAQRSGSLTEKYINRFATGLDAYQIVGNPNLKAETNNQTEVIYTFSKDKIYFQTNIFYAYLQNYISGVINPNIKPTSMQSPGVRQMENLKKAMKAGIESKINWQLLPNYKTEIAIAYTYAKDLTTNNPLAEIAPFALRWNTEAQFLKYTFGINYRFSGAQNRINPNFGELKTPDFSVFDIYSRCQITPNIYLNFDISNIFNRAYSEYLSRTLVNNNQQRISERGRSFNIGFTYNF